MMNLYPGLVAPLFNKFTPLPEGTLRQKLEALSSSLNFPLRKLFVVDGSLRSSLSNAYMYGFYNNKRIVLYDTLLQQCEEEEIVAVIVHEMEHWKLNHTVYSFIGMQADAFAKKLGYGTHLRKSLVKLQEENLLSMNTDPLFSAYHYSQPPLVERLAVLDEPDKKAD